MHIKTKPTPRSNPLGRRRGVMLLIVTLVLATLTLSGVALLTLMKTERSATTTRGRDALVKGVDRSAVEFLIAAVESTDSERNNFGGLYNNPNYFCAKELLSITEGGEDTSRFTVVSPKFEDSRIDGIRYGLVDESTRLNLEAILAWENEEPGSGRDALMKLPGMTLTAASSILDWIDPDETQRSNGGESKYYAGKKLPYSPRNATPVFLEELLLVRGVTRSQLYGTDEDFTYGVNNLDPSEESGLGGSLTSVGNLSSRTSQTQNRAVPWKELLTVLSAEKDVDPSGEARVDLNASDLSFLYEELEARVGAELAKFIVLYRQYGPQESTDENVDASNAQSRRANSRRRSGYFRNAEATSNALNVSADGAPLTQGTLSSVNLDFTTSASVKLATPLDLVGARVVVGSIVYESPIGASVNKTNNDKLFQLLDYCSTSSSTTIVGRVNINAAPRVVLSAIPGLSSGDVDNIMNRRPDPSQALSSDFRHASWLYTQGLVNLDAMRKLYDKICGRGDVYRGQVIGFLDGSDETARAEVVVDGTTVPPRQVFYKDLTTLGKGFSPSVLLGGGASGATQERGGTDADWNSVSTDLFEIQNGRTSGYVGTSDPFASIDASLNSTLGATGTGTGANLNVATNTLGGGETLGAASANESVNTPSALGTTSSNAVSGETSGTSRRDRMIAALQQAREQRQSRYEEASRETESSAIAENAPTEVNSSTSNPTDTQPAIDASTPNATAGEESSGNSRRERLLEALRQAREQRQSRYEQAN